MEKELLQKIENLAHLLLTPAQIGDLLEMSGEQIAEFQTPWSETGKIYRRVLAERAKELHEKTLRLADVGSPSAIEQANSWLETAQISIE